MQKELASILNAESITDLQKWRTFLAIGELGSLTRAATFLRCDQSILSRQMAVLERSCGSRLFNRTGRGVELSEVGQRLFPRALKLLAMAEEFEADIRADVHEPVGRVVVGAFPSIGVPLFERLCAEVRKKYPRVKLKIQECSSAQLDEWLADARIDIGVVYRYASMLLEREQALGTVDDYLVGPVGDLLSSSDEVDFQQLDGIPLILPSEANGIREALERLARPSHVSLDVVIEVDSLSLQKHLVSTGGMYTILPLHAVWQEVQKGELQAARIVSPSLRRTIAMTTSKTKGPSRAVSAISAEIVRIFEEMALVGMLVDAPENRSE